MHGQAATIKDIVLQERPDVVDLHCHEQLLDSSEEEVDDRDSGEQPVERAQQAHRVVTTCGICNCLVRLVVLSGDAELRRLQQLLTDALEIVCPGCA
uniref:Protein E7 n=3 Tax=Human papillomavirus 62 TaxID=334210 RepID=A0A159DZ19_HPV62|nr:E7 [human papillomavirus 62]ALT54934.1 E7 [human papillomavirus 62]WAB53685.1 E7 [human papillomavirus 62]WAB53990.1 E7 [human papillomavirus 62]WBM83558.1 E7 protein [human papillomavirus 62]